MRRMRRKKDTDLGQPLPDIIKPGLMMKKLTMKGEAGKKRNGS